MRRRGKFEAQLSTLYLTRCRSVFGRLVNQSLWPNILGTDTAGFVKVDKRIRLMTIVSTVATIMLAISAALTPLGLSDSPRLTKLQDTSFTYFRDTSPIGQATPSRENYVMNRFCGDLMSCPGNNDPFDFQTYRNGTTSVTPDESRKHRTLSTSIASNITEVFTSATKHPGSTIASIFDIGHRFFANFNSDYMHNYTSNTTAYGWVDHGQPRTQGQFRFSQDLIVDSQIQAIEGLIVSTLPDQPGIGFRNHTLPSSTALGYTWKEQILWLEPETKCEYQPPKHQLMFQMSASEQQSPPEPRERAC